MNNHKSLPSQTLAVPIVGLNSYTKMPPTLFPIDEKIIYFWNFSTSKYFTLTYH